MKSVDAGAKTKCWITSITLTGLRSSKSFSNSSWLVQYRMRLALKTNIPAARLGKISKVSKPIILSKSMYTYTCSRTIVRLSMKPLGNFLIVESIMYLNWAKS